LAKLSCGIGGGSVYAYLPGAQVYKLC